LIGQYSLVFSPFKFRNIEVANVPNSKECLFKFRIALVILKLLSVPTLVAGSWNGEENLQYSSEVRIRVKLLSWSSKRKASPHLHLPVTIVQRDAS
jgi:hypothetical protein